MQKLAKYKDSPHVVWVKGSETCGVVNKGQKGPAHSSKSELELERNAKTSKPWEMKQGEG